MFNTLIILHLVMHLVLYAQGLYVGLLVIHLGTYPSELGPCENNRSSRMKGSVLHPVPGPSHFINYLDPPLSESARVLLQLASPTCFSPDRFRVGPHSPSRPRYEQRPYIRETMHSALNM